MKRCLDAPCDTVSIIILLMVHLMSIPVQHIHPKSQLAAATMAHQIESLSHSKMAQLNRLWLSTSQLWLEASWGKSLLTVEEDRLCKGRTLVGLRVT
jgi:hypothetical protein